MYKKIIIVMLIVLGAFTTFFLYRTYAYDTSVVEDTPTSTDKAYTFKIGNSSIKQIQVDAGETKYFDIVLSNPNNAKISYSIYYEMVSPTTKPDGFSIWYTSKSTGDSTGKVDKNGNITLAIEISNTSSSAVTVKIGSVAGYVNGGKLTLGSGQVVIPNAPNFVEKLDDGSTGDSGSGVYKVEHSAIASSNSATGSEIPAVTDYRYYGADPNNYICLDKEGQSTCPDRGLFRIIGSIYEENAGKNLLKVIKATPLTDGTTSTFSWDYKVTNGSGSYNNVWSSTTSGTSSGSSLMQLLNGIYLTGGAGDYYNNSTTATTINFGSMGLTKATQNLMYIGEGNNLSKYYLGGYEDGELKTNDIYLAERGKTTSSGNALYWDGKVGLMYSSDYGYAAGYTCATNTSPYNYDSGCRTKDWLYRKGNIDWTMTPYSADARSVWYVYNGYVGNRNSYYLYASRPVFYLKSSVSISSGTGTSTDPYIVS